MGGFSRAWAKGRFAPGYRDYLTGAAISGSGLEQRTKSAPVFQSCAAAQRNCNGTRKNPPIKEGLFANVPSTAKQMVCPSGTTYYVGRETMSKHLNLRSKRDFFSLSVSSHEGRLP